MRDRPRCALLTGVGLPLLAFGFAVGSDPDASSSLPDRIVCAQVPARESNGGVDPLQLLDSQGILPRGSRIVAVAPGDPASGAVNLTPGFAAAGRPDLSFDAKRILFVAKKDTAEPFAVWEMGIDGANVRRVTHHAADCRDACYLPGLSTIDSERPTRQVAFSGSENGQPEAIYTCRLDGSRATRITYSPYGAGGPFVLSDGRLLMSVWSSGGRDSRAAALFTIHTDGTDIFPFAGLHERPSVRSMPCETADGSIVYVESAADGRERGGSLVAVARTRSLHTRRRIASGAEGLYRSPSTLPDGRLLVSYRHSKAETYGVYVLDPRTGAQTTKLFDDPDWHDIDAIAVRPREEPRGRSSVVDHRARSGKLYGLDAYASNTETSARIEPGQIKKVRVVQAIVGPEDSARVTEVPIGDAPVETDGSFFLEVPAQTPLRLETLDDRGEVLQAMSSWIWVMPKESRGCIGCHEDRELTPPNRHAYALMKRPTVLPQRPTREKEGDSP